MKHGEKYVRLLAAFLLIAVVFIAGCIGQVAPWQDSSDDSQQTEPPGSDDQDGTRTQEDIIREKAVRTSTVSVSGCALDPEVIITEHKAKIVFDNPDDVSHRIRVGGESYSILSGTYAEVIASFPGSNEIHGIFCDDAGIVGYLVIEYQE